MNDQGLKAPAPSVWGIFIMFVLVLLTAFDGPTWQFAAGVSVIMLGLWSTWQIGRWGWRRFGPSTELDFVR